MKIKNTKIKIIKGDIRLLKVDAIVVEDSPSVSVKARHVINADTRINKKLIDQNSLRQGIVNAFKQVRDLKIKSVAFSGVGASSNDFPVIGAAKIMAQEILKFARYEKNSTNEIIVCLKDEKLYQTFFTTISGYITHIQDDLGQGPYVTVDIIIELKDGIVVIERSNPPYGFALPGGFVDYGESLEDSARREAKEETHLDLINLRQFHTYSNPKRDPRFHTISTVFISKGKGKPQFGDDAKGLKVVAYKDLLKLQYAFDHKSVIKDYLAQRKNY